jgi:hypothetical protein
MPQCTPSTIKKEREKNSDETSVKESFNLIKKKVIHTLTKLVISVTFIYQSHWEYYKSQKRIRLSGVAKD